MKLRFFKNYNIFLLFLSQIVGTWKNDYAEILKNLVRYRFKNNFVGLSKNYVENSSMMSNAAKFLYSSNQLERPT